MTTNTAESAEEAMSALLEEMAGLRTALVELVESEHEGMIDRRGAVAEVAAAFTAASERASAVIEDSQQTCNELLLSTEDKNKYMKQIDSLQQLRSTVVDLIELDDHVIRLKTLVDVDFDLEVHNIYAISKEMLTIQSLLSRSTETLQIKCLQVFQAIIRNLYEIKLQLKEKIEEVWDSKIVINRMGKNPYFNYANPSENKEIIPISKSIIFGLEIPVLREILYLMFQVELGYKMMESVMSFVCGELIYPAIDNFQVYCLSSTIDSNKICISLNSKDVEEPMTLEYVFTFLDNLKNTLKIIHENLLCIAHTEDNDVQKTNLIIGVQKENFDKSLTKALMTTFIPETSDFHQELLSKLTDFNVFLVEYKFIHQSNITLKEYIENFDVCYRESESYNMLVRGRFFCLQPLLIFGEKVRCVSNMSDKNDYDNINKELPNFSKYIDLQSLMFPECNVSKYVLELVEMITEFFDYIDVQNENNSVKVVDTLRILPDILMMYLTVVPISNQDALKSIPQAAALHYNNIMYIAHKSMVLTPLLKSVVDATIQTFKSCSPHEQILLNNAPTSLLTLVYTMRNAAADTIATECHKQKEQLTEFFAEIDTFINISSSNQRAKVEKVFKKCHLYLHSLSLAYAVFPERVYEAFFGGLLMEHVLVMVSEKVLSMTDIVQSDNRSIVITIQTFESNLLDTISEHFKLQMSFGEDKKDPESFMMEHVSSWEKVKSLLFILNGNLMEIEDRYLNGKGPLALYFSGQELRTLIKALFKHGTLRTKILENIH